MKPTLKPGIHTQLYRGVTGFSRGLDAWLNDAHAHGVVGQIFHGFVGEMTAEVYKRFQDRAQAAGYQCGAAFGLGDVGTHGADVGRKLAVVGKIAGYLVLDMEGAWEDDALDVQKATEMLDALRQAAPDILLLDQPPSRPIAHHHGSILWKLMAKWTDARCPQWYWNNLRFQGVKDGVHGLGDDAMERLRPDLENDWNVIVPRDTPKGITPDPVVPTVQAYHWTPSTLVDYLLAYPTTLMWCENHNCGNAADKSSGPYPTPVTRREMRVAHELHKQGFEGASAVARFRAARGLPPATMRTREDGKPSSVPVIDAAFLAALGVAG